MSSGVLGVPVRPDLGDPQLALLAQLVTSMTKDTLSVQNVLDLAEPHLRAAAGLTAATVYELDAETGLLNPAARIGEPGTRDMLTAGKVFRLPAGAPPRVDGERMAVRLRLGGNTIGVLLLTGTDLAALRPEVLTPLALHFSTLLQGLMAEKQRQFMAHSSATIRRLFEEGMAATSVEDAGRVLADSAASAYRTEFAAVYLVDADGLIRYVHAVGLPGSDRLLSDSLVGKLAADSPAWRSIESGTPALVGDVSQVQVRMNGIVQVLGLKSYLALPLMSNQGPVGMIMCGDRSTREWTGNDRSLAEQLSVEGALIVDSAEMRQAAHAQAAQLRHQAYHDSLTGLPNRSHLLGKAEEAVARAAESGEQAAMLLLDLNGFKQVNDTAGHQAGDILLQRVAQRLLAAVRGDDVVARLGGDEFAILLTRDPDGPAAEQVAARICERLREPFRIEGTQVQVGGSVGIALFPDDATDYDALMRAADAAMYEAKRDTKPLGGGFRRATPEPPLT